MENTQTGPAPDHDPLAVLAGAELARRRLAAGLELPTGLQPALAGAIALQVGTAAYGIAAQTPAGLVAAAVGVAVFLGVAAMALRRFRVVNGVRVDGLASQIVLGTGATTTMVYVAAFVLATWAAFESRWWLVVVAAAAGGVGYALGLRRWWHSYRDDPAAHAPGTSPRMIASLTVVACLGFVALLVAG